MIDHELIPRKILFDTLRVDPKLSPDGKWIAFVLTQKGVPNIWLMSSRGSPDRHQISHETGRGVYVFSWANDSRHLIIAKDGDGDEKWQLFSANIESKKWMNISPFEDAETRISAFSCESPSEIVIESNGRTSRFFDLYRVNVATGSVVLHELNNQYTWIYVDQYLRPRLAELRTENGGVNYNVSDGDGVWDHFFSVSPEDETTTRPFRSFEVSNTFNADATEIYAMDSRGRDTAALVAWNLNDGVSRQIAEDRLSDISRVWIEHQSQEIFAYERYYDRPTLVSLRETDRQDFEYIRSVEDSHFSIVSQTADNESWIVRFHGPENPGSYVVFNRKSRKIGNIDLEQPTFEQHQLGSMHPTLIASRDDLNLVTYVTLPPSTQVRGEDRPDSPLATVVLVHGGPWTRDVFEFDPWIQLLANRGYAVLSINFRGSSGFGKSFLNAGNQEWGGKIFDDIEDGIAWSIQNGITDPDKIAIMGASFGGYATLVGLTRLPKLFACGIDLFGVSNLTSFLETIPPYWKEYKSMWRTRVGDPLESAGAKLLRDHSPFFHIDKLTSPVLIAQGANDPRVVKQESDQMAQALEKNALEVVYMVFPDEGHAFVRTPNLLSFVAGVEIFLRKHLGGNCEPIGHDIVGSSITVPIGNRYLPDLRLAKLIDPHSKEEVMEVIP